MRWTPKANKRCNRRSKGFRKGGPLFVVAHRLATVKKADRILVFEKGKVVAEGTHDELVAEQGLYARLARLQFTEGMIEPG